MDVNIKINQKVILDLGVESFVGNVSSIDSNFTRIRLKNVENLQTKIKYRGTQNFYFSKIKSITPLLDDSIQINDLESTSQSLHENNHTENINEKNVKIGLSEQEWDTINFTLDSIRVLDKNDASYFNAIKDLANQQSFIILMEDCDFGRNNNVSNIITLYSPATKLVYIFNMVCMRKLQKELHHILKLEKPKKIVFNSKILRDHLKLAQNIEDINGIFDVLAAYLIAFRKNESLDLISCVHKCFFIPENYFKTEIKYNWLSRPLNIDHIEFNAKKAIFLYKLYEYLLHKHLLKTFYQTCQTFSLSLCSIKDNVEVAYLMSNSDKTVEKLVQETDVELSFSTDQLKLSENNARK